MTITIEAKPLEVEAELPGYGHFFLRRMGAGIEADIRNKFAEANAEYQEITERAKPLIEQEKKLREAGDKDALAKLTVSDEYKKALKDQNEATRKINEVMRYSTECHLKLWRSEDPELMKRLLNDFTAEQIMAFHRQVMEKADNAES